VPDYYCVGPSMVPDWGDDGPPLSRALMQRVFGYFVVQLRDSARAEQRQILIGSAQSIEYDRH
jgi:hypothetical protein